MPKCIEKFLCGSLKSAASAAILLGIVFSTICVSLADEHQDRKHLKSLKQIKHIIVIYQENWSFDSLYGQFPGADGYAYSFDTLPQLRQDDHAGIFVANLPNTIPAQWNSGGD
jgi:phospholipase C